MKKSFLKKLKQSTAAVLSAAMVLGGFQGFGTGVGVAHAYQTELEPNTALMEGKPISSFQNSHYYDPSTKRMGRAASYGYGSTTAYKFGYIHMASQGSFDGWKFDINGLVEPVNNEPAHDENQEPYVISDGTDSGALNSTYKSSDPQGYTTAVGFGPTKPTSYVEIGRVNVKKSEYTGSDFHPGRDGEIKNGEVVKVFGSDNKDLKLEMRLSVKPSPDKKYILAEYTVYNANTSTSDSDSRIVDTGRTDGGRTVWFATGTDIMVAEDDYAPAWATKKGAHDGRHIEGIHAQGHNNKKYTLGALDILTYHPQLNLGIAKRESGDPSNITSWIGYYGNYSSNYFTDLNDYSYMPGGTNTSSTDSGIAYSLRFDLLPGETKTGTIAFSMRGPTYYVDPVGGNDSTGDGFLSKPFKTTKKALEVIGSRGPKKVFVFLMNDETISETLTIPAGKDVTIQTTDYVMDQTTQAKTSPYPIEIDGSGERTNSKKIIRGTSLRGDMFNVSNANSNLTFSDIVIDGNKSATQGLPENQQPIGSLVNASAGNIMTQRGAIFQNNKIVSNGTDATVASAINISGSANLKMDYGVVKDNESYQGGAINIEGSGKMTVANNVNVTDNINGAGGKSNVRLGPGQVIGVVEPLPSSSRIGVMTKNPPASGTAEVNVAEKLGNHSSLPYSVSNFPADKSPAQWTQLTEDSTNDNRVVLKATQAAFSVNYVYTDDNGNDTTVKTPRNTTLVSGTAINEAPPVIPNYIYKSVEVTPPNHGLSVNNTTGNVNGTMPGVDVNIKYKYERNVGIAYFNPDGGLPANIPPIESAVGVAPSANMPTVSKTGYTFAGWFKVNIGPDNTPWTGDDTLDPAPSATLPSPVAQGKIYFKAKWNPDTTGRPFEVTHKNTNTTIPFVFKQDTVNKPYLDETRADKVVIPGYKNISRNANPSNKGQFGGTFQHASGNVTANTDTEYVGRMPLGDLKVNYMYNVDPTQNFEFKVEHVTTGGVTVGTAVPPIRRVAEAPINASPLNLPGYTLQGASITRGKTDNSANNVIGLDTIASSVAGSAVDANTATFDGSKNFNSYMPNQDVTITYTYSAAGYTVARNYLDSTSHLAIGIPKAVSGYQQNDPILPRGAGVLDTAASKYGYTYGSSTVDPASTVTVQANGAITGTVPGSDVTVTHMMNRDGNYWKNMTFAVAAAPYDKGSISTVAPISFLIDDPNTSDVEEEAHRFSFISATNAMPVPTPQDAPFYRFAGWYTDAAATNKVLDGTTFQGDTVLYAKFEKDPAYWIDINFDSDDKGSISAPSTLNVKNNATWASIASERPSPVNSVPNYIFDRWTINGNNVDDSTVLVPGTYHANFKKDPNIWGLNIGDFNASGHIASDGKGQIRVRQTQAGNVYIITDENDNVVAVRTAPDDSVLPFDGLYPGTRYKVREAVPGTNATVGQPVPSGSGISAPKTVDIPTLENNYNVGFDPVNEDRSQIVVNPADPDSDYALLDEDGNVVHDWKTPVGNNPATVTFDNLDPGKTYKVVARKKGDTSVTPASKSDLGTNVNANPGDMAEANKYIVEVKPGDNNIVKILSVGGKTPSERDGGSDLKVIDAKAEEEVSVHAEAVDANGRAFKYWVVISGRSKNISGKITNTDFTFKLSGSNVVLKAVYEKTRPNAHSGNAENIIVDEEIRGGASGEYALDPDGIEGVESRLTTPADRVLIGQGADVRYRVVFNKRQATSTEVANVKPISESGHNHPDAFSTAWALDIKSERYIDGRFVGEVVPPPATPSNATVPVLVQLPAEDTDMMDYQLFDVTDASTLALGAIDNFATDESNNPEKTAGYFSFTGEIGHKYVLVYSKAFKLRFIDNNQSRNYLDFDENGVRNNFYHMFKVRKKDSAIDYLSGPDEYARVIAYAGDPSVSGSRGTMVTPFIDVFGVRHTYLGWSRSNMPANIRPFDQAAEITSRQVLYAYYDNNRTLREQAKTELEGLKVEAEDIIKSPYLKNNEVDELKQAIARAAARLAQKRGELLDKSLFETGGGQEDPLRMATQEELEDCINELKRLIDEYKSRISARDGNFKNRTGGGGSGGGTGSAGRGNGTASRPFEATSEKTFTLGVDGSWKINEQTGRWSFVLNGGLPLNNTWGKIQYKDAAGKLLTKWYFFDNQSSMAQGWYHDTRADKWYFLNDSSGADAGQMVTGWYRDAAGMWYYLDPVLGEMYVGWRQVGDPWYYFSPSSVESHPKGSLYVNTTTPDGYRVNHNGEWVQ